MIEIVNTVIRLGVIQPESIDAVIVVVLLAYVPDIFSCLRIEHVDLNAVTLEIVCLLFRADCPCMFFILLAINEQISNFAQTYPTNLKASSNEALLFMRRYRFANCSCFSCCFKDAYPSSNVQ